MIAPRVQVLEQYERTVKPSFESYISPTKKYADIIVRPFKDRSCSSHAGLVGARLQNPVLRGDVNVQIPRGAENTVALDVILQHIKFRLVEAGRLGSKPAAQASLSGAVR